MHGMNARGGARHHPAKIAISRRGMVIGVYRVRTPLPSLSAGAKHPGFGWRHRRNGDGRAVMNGASRDRRIMDVGLARSSRQAIRMTSPGSMA